MTKWNEICSFYQRRATIELRCTWLSFSNIFANHRMSNYNDVVQAINELILNSPLFYANMDEKYPCNLNLYSYLEEFKKTDNNSLIKNFAGLKLNSRKYSIPLLLVNLKSELQCYSEKRLILSFVFNQFLLDQNPHINFKTNFKNNDNYTYADFLKYLNLEFNKYYNDSNFKPKLSSTYFISFRNNNDNQKILTNGINILKLWINRDEFMRYDLPVNWTNEVTLIEKKYTRFAIYAITSQNDGYWSGSGWKIKPICNGRKRIRFSYSHRVFENEDIKGIRTTDLKVGQPQKTADKWIKDFLIHNAYARMILRFAPNCNNQRYCSKRVKGWETLDYENDGQRVLESGKEKFLEENDVETIVCILEPNLLFNEGFNIIKTIIKIDGFRIPIQFRVILD